MENSENIQPDDTSKHTSDIMLPISKKTEATSGETNITADIEGTKKAEANHPLVAICCQDRIEIISMNAGHTAECNYAAAKTLQRVMEHQKPGVGNVHVKCNCICSSNAGQKCVDGAGEKANNEGDAVVPVKQEERKMKDDEGGKGVILNTEVISKTQNEKEMEALSKEPTISNVSEQSTNILQIISKETQSGRNISNKSPDRASGKEENISKEPPGISQNIIPERIGDNSGDGSTRKREQKTRKRCKRNAQGYAEKVGEATQGISSTKGKEKQPVVQREATDVCFKGKNSKLEAVSKLEQEAKLLESYIKRIQAENDAIKKRVGVIDPKRLEAGERFCKTTWENSRRCKADVYRGLGIPAVESDDDDEEEDRRDFKTINAWLRAQSLPELRAKDLMSEPSSHSDLSISEDDSGLDLIPQNIEDLVSQMDEAYINIISKACESSDEDDRFEDEVEKELVKLLVNVEELSDNSDDCLPVQNEEIPEGNMDQINQEIEESGILKTLSVDNFKNYENDLDNILAEKLNEEKKSIAKGLKEGRTVVMGIRVPDEKTMLKLAEEYEKECGRRKGKENAMELEESDNKSTTTLKSKKKKMDVKRKTEKTLEDDLLTLHILSNLWVENQEVAFETDEMRKLLRCVSPTHDLMPHHLKKLICPCQLSCKLP